MWWGYLQTTKIIGHVEGSCWFKNTELEVTNLSLDFWLFNLLTLGKSSLLTSGLSFHLKMGIKNTHPPPSFLIGSWENRWGYMWKHIWHLIILLNTWILKQVAEIGNYFLKHFITCWHLNNCWCYRIKESVMWILTH